MNGWTRTGTLLFAACFFLACTTESTTGDETTSGEEASERTLDSADAPAAEPEPPRWADEKSSLVLANGAYASLISHNHPRAHTLVIPASALASGKGNVFALSNGGGALDDVHGHFVAVPREAIARIAAGEEVTVESTPAGARGGHTHTVVLKLR